MEPGIRERQGKDAVIALVNRWVFMGLVLGTTALMGSSFAVGKVGLLYMSPLLLAGVRFVLAGLGMIALVVMARRPHPHGWADWARVAAVGLFQTAGVMGPIFISMRTITASEASILTFVNPLWVVVLGTLLGARYRPAQWIGVLAGFFGVAMTLGFDFRLQPGTGVALGGSVSWAVATVLINRWRRRFDVWVLTAYQMLFGGIILLAASTVIERWQFAMTPTAIAVILWLVVMGSIVQFAIWFFLLQHGDPGKISAFLFLAPFFGVLSGWLMLHEPITRQVLLGGVFIFAGIFLVNWSPADKKRERAT